MSLTIIKGPPNSGRTELMRERYESRLADDPVLVVPSTDDIFGWERRLTRDRGAFLGGKVVHFKDLVDEILGDESSAREYGGKTAIASPLTRRALAAEAIRSGWPAIAGRLGDQPGLIDAALQTIDEFRENLIGPESFEDEDVAGEVGPIAAVYREYLDRLGQSGLTDLPARAALASARPLDEWQGRPVFIAGFDDLTARQLELLRRLSLMTDVTIAITHEQGNQAMAVTEALLGRLEAIGATVEKETARPPSAPDHAPLLVELERSFLDSDHTGTLKPGDALTLIEASGRRGEAEAIGAEIARLVDRGIDPGEIAIAIDAPATNGQAILELLAEYEIPATLEAETKAPETATGQAVMNLLRAGAANGDADHFFMLLRGPLGVDIGKVDEAEFEARRSGIERAAEAKAVAARHGIELPGWDQMAGGDPGGAVKTVARACARTLVGSRPDLLPDASVAIETQMATAINRAVDEISELQGGKVDSESLLEALSSGAVKTWAIPTAHTVQISSPYSMRAKRAGYLFVASLQEKDLGGGEGSPLISRQARATLGMPELTDQEQQETYLFYSCLAVPTRGLWLSHRVADVHGKAEFPSAMIGEVKRLFVDDGSGLNLIRRSSSDVLFPAGRAPSIHEWALSEAASGEGEGEAEGTEAEAGEEHPGPDPIPAAIGEIARAREIERSTRVLRDIDSDEAVAGLAAGNVFSATALEAFIECPYRWFFERAIRPERFGPDPEPLAKGNLVHEVLAELYRSHPGELPTGSDIDQWIAEMRTLVERLAGSCDLGDDSATHRIQRNQVATQMARFLRREATREGSRYRPVDLERKFGFDGDDSMPPLEGEGWSLRGVIDRIDADSDKNGVVIDYKSGASSYKSLAVMKREGKIQLHLYLKALEQHWGLNPVAGLYVPIFAAQKKARGMVDKEKSGSLKDIGLVARDYTTELNAEIEAGFELAAASAAKILRGEIEHDPASCLNHYAHAGVPDWTPDSASDGGRGEGKWS